MNFIAKYPDINAAKNPNISGKTEVPAMFKPLPDNSKIDEPMMIGMDIKNENLAMVVFSLPKITPVEIVLPLLDRPGKTANP